MPYVNVDENLPDHRKVLALPRQYRPQAMWLWMRGMCYSSRHLTDGHIPAGFPETDDEDELAAMLCDAGLWRPLKAGWVIHDYCEWNRSRAEVEAIREARREAGKRGGEAKALASAKQTPSKRLAKTYPDTDTKTDTDTETSPLSLRGVPDSVLGYWSDKIGREPNDKDARSLRLICRTFPPEVVNFGIGQLCVQGEQPDNYALLTTICKKEVT